MKLKEFAEIKSGYLFRFGIKSDKEGDMKVIQLKDVNDDGVLTINGISSVEFVPSKKTEFLQRGDILFKAKSNKHVAAMFKSDMKNVIATAHYFIISVKNIEIRPEYLAWYLNQQPAQVYFGRNASGTRIRVINKQILGELEIMAPELKIQDRIERIYQLYNREQDLLDVIKEKRHKILLDQLLSVINK
jgi:restriction endonuclease S subunit